MVYGSIATKTTVLAEKKEERTKASRTTRNGNLTDLDPGLVTKDWNRATLARKLGDPFGGVKHWKLLIEDGQCTHPPSRDYRYPVKIVLSAFRVVH
jgi:hypothetical protein